MQLPVVECGAEDAPREPCNQNDIHGMERQEVMKWTIRN